jgi:hypothetical protein
LNIPLTEPGVNDRKIPVCVFIEDIGAWAEKYGAEPLMVKMNELY